MKSQIKNLAFPIVWELLFIAFSIIKPFKTLYIFFVFYLVLLVYYSKDFSFAEYSRNFRSFKKFWIPVVLTAVATQLAYIIKQNLIMDNFIGVLDGTYGITWENSYIGEFLYAITLLFLCPVSEELFFRKALMDFDSATSAMLTFVLGLVLCGFSYAYLPLGVVSAMVLAIPYAIAFFCTRNIYIPITVHILFMMYQHIPSIIIDVARISLR
ncbi:CPBP family intramembrane glutamic endopeptidase [Butyrivibrio sp. LC3010]|uniref:CPBP family intramembrane glutamic endopeptidase n=1 Tax=Butyrivibrio sp. LC3010 TaxID=1280680 RepID=UPI00047C6417|nr:CPBP family intramembrane glutamic endopeptidase [Butyrivibrio sp. LC3010]